MQIKKLSTAFLKVNRKETQAAVVPNTTSAKMGIPAREKVSSTANVARLMLAAQSMRKYFGKLDVAAATSTGVTMQRYIERLLGWSKVPVTRSMCPIIRSFKASKPSKPTAQARAITSSPSSFSLRMNQAAVRKISMPRRIFVNSNMPNSFGEDIATETQQ